MSFGDRILLAFQLVGHSILFLLRRPWLFVYMMIPGLISVSRILYYYYDLTLPMEIALSFLSTLLLAAFLYHAFNILEGKKVNPLIIFRRLIAVILPLALLTILNDIKNRGSVELTLYMLDHEFPEWLLIKKIPLTIWFIIFFYVPIFIVIEKKSFIQAILGALSYLRSTWVETILGIFCIWVIMTFISFGLMALFVKSDSPNTEFLLMRKVVFGAFNTIYEAFGLLLYLRHRKTAHVA